MTMLRGGDFEVVDGEVWVKSSVVGGGLVWLMGTGGFTY